MRSRRGGWGRLARSICSTRSLVVARLDRAIQYAAHSRLNHRCLWNTGSPAQPGDDDRRMGGWRELVIPRACGVSSTPRPIGFNHRRLWNTGSPACAGDDSCAQRGRRDTSPRSRRASRPRFCNSFTPFNQEGAGNAGRRLAPAVSCANSAEDTHTSIQVQPEQPGIPCAMGLRLIPCSPWRRIPLASIAGGLKALRNPVGFRKTSAGLTPATGARTTRLCRPRPRRSSARGFAHRHKARPAKTCLRARRSVATAPRTQRP
jgi:hypothetical protein